VPKLPPEIALTAADLHDIIKAVTVEAESIAGLIGLG
jgi:HD superfamily phosphodiesterase